MKKKRVIIIFLLLVIGIIFCIFNIRKVSLLKNIVKAYNNLSNQSFSYNFEQNNVSNVEVYYNCQSKIEKVILGDMVNGGLNTSFINHNTGEQITLMNDNQYYKTNTDRTTLSIRYSRINIYVK